jgi:hypothetical protein
MKEPCLCGAPDCRRCFPFSWRENMLRAMWERDVTADTAMSFEEWLAEYEAESAEHRYDVITDR